MGAIDPTELDAQTGGDADLAREVLDLFAGQCRTILPRLTDPDLPRVQRADLAHTLKGSAAGVGAVRVRALCEAAETHLRTDAQDAEAELDALGEAVEAALGEITRRT